MNTFERLYANIKTKKACISLLWNNEVVACGTGVVERDYIGLYNIVTDPQHRNNGFAEQVIYHLLKWGKENGATHSYLAVLQSNEPAKRLYAKIGFTDTYAYWYRVKK